MSSRTRRKPKTWKTYTLMGVAILAALALVVSLVLLIIVKFTSNEEPAAQGDDTQETVQEVSEETTARLNELSWKE